MRSILYRSLLVLVLVLFALTLADVSSGFALLSAVASLAVGLVCLLTAIALSRAFTVSRSLIPLTLLLSCCVAVACRLGGYETVAHRTDEEWEAHQHQLGSRLADEVTLRFTELCQRAKWVAESLAEEPSLAKAVEELGSRVSLLEAFKTLESISLPRPLEEAVGGVTLYDAWHIPLAWAGKNADLSPFFDLLDVGEGGRTFTLEQGVFTYLVAVAPLADSSGSVSVEIPLAARRSLDNRYQTDYEVVTAWAGKSISTDFVDVREEAPELTSLFERTADRYWGGTREAPVLYFPLRSPTDDVLGVCSLKAEDPSTALLEHQRSSARLAGIALVTAALIIVGILAADLWRSARQRDQGHAETLVRALLLGGAAVGLRIVLLLTDVPLGLGTDADNPVYYASGIFFDFLRSPADFLVTAILILICTLALLLPFTPSMIIRSKGRPRPVTALIFRGVVSAAVLVLLILVNGLVQNTWMNSNLPLASPGLAPPNPPLLAVQLGLLLVFCAAGVASVFLFSLCERWTDHRVYSVLDVLQLIAVDLVVFALGYALLSFVSPTQGIVPTVVPLVVFHLIAIERRSIRNHLHSANIYPRLATAFLMALAPVLSFYPAVVFFEGQSIRQFMESTVAPAVLHHGDSKQYVLLKTLEAVDRMELSGRLGLPEQTDLAYRIWSDSDLSVSALSSSVEIYDEQQRLVSRFALNFPSIDWSAEQSRESPETDWEIEQVPYPGEPNRPRVMNARRAFQSKDGSLWDIRIRLVADWTNLPFISARNPYIDLFRAPGTETPLPSPHGELSLYVFDLDGNLLFRSSETVLTLDRDTIQSATQSRAWVDHFEGGQEHNVLLFSDPEYVFALSYQGKTALGYFAEIVGWTILATAAGFILLVFIFLIGIAAGYALISPQDIWAGVGTSFYGKLFVAFVLLALVPTISLAVLARGVVVQQLEGDVEQEGVARARVVERFVWDYLLYQTSERRVAAIDDSFLEWLRTLVNSDMDLYSRGELVATSKRELFASGLLPTRAVPAVFRQIVLDRADYSIHREAVGSFQYLVVSVPIALERWGEPGILSLPLASRQQEINRQVATLNQTVLLAAICFSLVAATLAYSLARRIAEPINRLTAATQRVAQGDFDVALEAPSQDEIGALSSSFNRMTSDLKRQREDLERTKKLEAWAEMARQVAHEVKNPLTPIQLSTEHLRRVVNDDTVDFKKVLTECTDTILQQVRTLRQISMEFSTFANPAPIEPEPTDFARLVRETVEPYCQAPPSGVTVDLSVDTSLPQLAVDKRLIQRTLVNLLENAFHALNGHGHIKVVARPIESQDKQWVEVSVSDSGAGIEPELHERIFEPYFSTRAGGTGLGLAIAKKAVEEHGGSITLESEPGEGTLVRVRLPVASTYA